MVLRKFSKYFTGQFQCGGGVNPLNYIPPPKLIQEEEDLLLKVGRSLKAHKQKQLNKLYGLWFIFISLSDIFSPYP